MWAVLNGPQRAWQREPVDPAWRRAADGRFHRLVDIDVTDPVLCGQEGVYLLWHGGIRPRWVEVGSSADLAGDFTRLLTDPELASFAVHGGLFVTWAPAAADSRHGIAAFLRPLLCPVRSRPPAGSWWRRVWARRGLRRVRVIPVAVPV